MRNVRERSGPRRPPAPPQPPGAVRNEAQSTHPQNFAYASIPRQSKTPIPGKGLPSKIREPKEAAQTPALPAPERADHPMTPPPREGRTIQTKHLRKG